MMLPFNFLTPKHSMQSLKQTAKPTVIFTSSCTTDKRYVRWREL